MNSINTNSVRKHTGLVSHCILVLLCILFTVSSTFAQMQIGQDIDGEAAFDYSGASVSMSANGKRVIIGADRNGGNGQYAGHARVYGEINGNWIQIGQDINGEAPNDISGGSVAISSNGKKVVIGAVSNNWNTGHMRVYEELNGIWVQVGQDIDGAALDQTCGWSVSISDDGSRVAMGCPRNDDNGTDSGNTRIFELVSGNWVQIGQDIGGEAADDVSGRSVSLSANGTRVAIGAMFNSNNNGQMSGHTRIYEEINGTWIQIGQDIDGKSANDRAGSSVSISNDGTIVAIGAITDGSTGSARVYKEINGVWTQIGQDIDGVISNENAYFVSISDDGTLLGIGAPHDATSSPGSGRAFEEVNGNWIQVGQDMIGEASGDGFGRSVSIAGDGTRLAIGGHFNDGNGQQSGHARIFQLNNGTLFSNYLTGNVVHDLNLNCSIDPAESGLENWLLQATGALGTTYTYTDAAGYYEINVDSGSYSLKIIPPNQLWSACQPVHFINVAGNDTIQTDFTLAGIECPYLVVDVSTTLLRRCVASDYKVSYVNQGTIAATNAYVDVEFPSQMVINSSSIPWSSQVGNTYSFFLGTINTGVSGNFTINATPSCDSTIIGQTLCVEANIFPDSVCTPSDPSWDGSITTLDVTCQPDSVTFIIKNTGNGDMLTPQEYFVIEDDLIMRQGFFQLLSNESIPIKVPSNGSTYRIYAGQAPGHFPPTHFPTTAIEGCGVDSSGNFSLGFVSMYQEADVIDQISIDCQEIRGPYDPNDKRAEPKGYGTEHYINIGDDLDYHIRFQNVGNDTAFLVVILDTISEYLDIASLQQGAASHPYQLEIVDGNVLKFTFDNILLVDSTTNESESNGFVKFKISQVPNLPLGTMIYNSAGIYFDFNAPIITNQAYHEIGVDFIPEAGSFCPDLATTSYIIPATTSGLSTIEVAIKISEVNNIDTDGRPITVRMPSDPRLLFTWDVGLVSAAFLPVQNADWNYLGDNGVYHSWTYTKPSLVIDGGSSSTFGLRAFFDPQSTSGTTSFSATVVPFSGGECNPINNSDVEQLVYFD